MSLRSFTVFQDTPSNDPPHPKPSSTSLSAPSSSLPLVSLNATTLLPSTVEKENVHPVTGERAGSTSDNVKKRKTAVLAPKSQPLAVKKLKDTQPEPKKRKSATASSSKVKPSTTRKEVKVTSTTRKATAKRSIRKLSPLPKVEEELDADKNRSVQADINSKCYDLTVQPLADVSQAYDETTAVTKEPSCDAKPKFRTLKESSAEPEIRDYYAPPTHLSTSLSSSTNIRAVDITQDTKVFSTPERKEIYAAFTFSSPSPTSERFNSLTRAASVPRLQFADNVLP